MSEIDNFIQAVIDVVDADNELWECVDPIDERLWKEKREQAVESFRAAIEEYVDGRIKDALELERLGA